MIDGLSDLDNYISDMIIEFLRSGKRSLTKEIDVGLVYRKNKEDFEITDDETLIYMSSKKWILIVINKTKKKAWGERLWLWLNLFGDEKDCSAWRDRMTELDYKMALEDIKLEYIKPEGKNSPTGTNYIAQKFKSKGIEKLRAILKESMEYSKHKFLREDLHEFIDEFPEFICYLLVERYKGYVSIYDIDDDISEFCKKTKDVFEIKEMFKSKHSIF